jgi:hypothetical protein
MGLFFPFPEIHATPSKSQCVTETQRNSPKLSPVRTETQPPITPKLSRAHTVLRGEVGMVLACLWGRDVGVGGRGGSGNPRTGGMAECP